MTDRCVVYTGPDFGSSLVATALGPGYRVEHADATPESLAAMLPRAHAILDASMKVPLSAALLGTATELRLVVTGTTGADHIDGAHLAARAIPLLTLKTEHELLRGLTPAAELSWLLLMACARRLRPAIHHVEEGGWARERFPGVMLNGRTLGLVGCGRLGGWMARYGTAFGMRVVGHDPHLAQWPSAIERTTLDDVMRQSDFISIHVHLSDETRGLIGASQLALARPGAILINTSRGACVSEDAVLDALSDGRIAAYGADVVEGEPDILASRVWQYAQDHPEVLITPHIGGFSPDAVAVVLRHSARRIAAYFGD